MGHCISLSVFASLSIENPINLCQFSDTVTPQTAFCSISLQAFLFQSQTLASQMIITTAGILHFASHITDLIRTQKHLHEEVMH